MFRSHFLSLAVLLTVQFIFVSVLPLPCVVDEWQVEVKPKGILRVVDLKNVAASILTNYGEGLVTLDKDNNLIPCLARDWK